MNQRTPGSNTCSNAAQIASALMTSASHIGNETCDVIGPAVPLADDTKRSRACRPARAAAIGGMSVYFVVGWRGCT
jgi:hypothetical protein